MRKILNRFSLTTKSRNERFNQTQNAGRQMSAKLRLPKQNRQLLV